MTMLDTADLPFTALADRTGVPEEATAELQALVAARAADVDAERADLRANLELVAERGLVAVGAPGNADGRLPEAVGVLSGLAQGCLSTAFSLWAHRMVVEYVAASRNPVLIGRILPRLAAGALTGSTAMATAFQAALGLREVEVRFDREGADLVLNGRIGWASNLFGRDTVVVLPARSGRGQHIIVAVPLDAPGVAVAAFPPLLALQATRSSAFTLEGVRVPSEWIVSEDFTGFLTAVRPTFLVLQAAFCVGLGEAALAAAAGRFDGAAAELAADHGRLLALHAAVSGELVEQAAGVGGPQPPDPVATTAMRLDAARLAVDAVHLEAKVRGGAGYVATSPTARRLREAAFLPIQSPTEDQLRWELSHSN